MPKGEIVGIKSVLPSVTTLSNITDPTELHSDCSVYRVLQWLPSTDSDYSSHRALSIHRVGQFSPSIHRVGQFSPST
jgi:hypothetical protein